ncbi:hypothetical protein [Georgenia ruanii]|uniref:hypothetical protein n=1 Tax=Georgenia ruanii TaxID=348442 RepID=UPI001264B4A3|nr:hypothetical protein [Georgenia ruanii]
MTRLADTTADNVVGAVQGVVAGRDAATADMVADFLDLPNVNAVAALELAEDLGLIRCDGNCYKAASPLARLLNTPVLAQRAAVLRIAVEAYEPFRVFRELLHLSGEGAGTAAQQTRALLGLAAHRETIKQTLLSLGTYCQSLRATAGGNHEVRFELEEDFTTLLAGAVAELAEAELRVRDWMSERARNYVDHSSVLQPLAEAYLKVSQSDSRGAVVSAGNAIESYLSQLASDMSVSVAGATGLGAKVDAFDRARALPKKVAAIGKYLSNVRNAADHGVDSDIGAAWTIRAGTGEDYLRISITFIEITTSIKDAQPYAV